MTLHLELDRWHAELGIGKLCNAVMMRTGSLVGFSPFRSVV